MISTLMALAAATLVVWFLIERSKRKTSAIPGGIDNSVILPHEHSWVLYHNDFSLCSKKMRVCLHELGIPHKLHHIDLIETGKYENLSRHFLKVNPGALLPVLIHNGHPIYESHEQLVYAAKNSHDPYKLIPQNDEQLKLMGTWIHKTSIIGDNPIAGMKETLGNTVPGLTLPIFATMIESISTISIFEGLLFHRFKQRAVLFLTLKLRGANRLPTFRPLVRIIQRSFGAAQEHLQELEVTLSRSDGPYIVGEQFTLADVGMMVIFDRFAEADWHHLLVNDTTPHVQQYVKDLQKRASYTAALAAHVHPTVVIGQKKLVELKKSNPEFNKVYSMAGI